MNTTSVLPPVPLPPSIRSRFVGGINGLVMHVLEAGFESKGRPCILLLHGFPELAFSWRKVMPALAQAGYHVIAPDQRGYGRTTGWDASYDSSLMPFRLTNLVRDALGVVSAFGHRTAAVVGHDFGSPVAAWCALIRPDVFRSVVLMSAPFPGAPSLPFDIADAPLPPTRVDPVHHALAALPRPRKHYHWYYSTREANEDMWRAPQGVHDFLRAYYHHKSADWKANKPYPLQSWSAAELAKLPTYYVMDLAKTMPETVAEEMPSKEEIAAAARWLNEEELAFYSAEYQRTGFQGGLQWYRCGTSNRFTAELETWSGRRIDVPSCFIAGRQDWGTHQRPGIFEAMQASACSRMLGCHFVDGAGHWVQQEQPDEVSRLLLQFLRAATD
jgi:pimeloyl-ACP methyl ester carboxylesterase